jgi:hypothetical protein
MDFNRFLVAVSPNGCVSKTMSPLFAAARYGKHWAYDQNLETVKLLVEAGADLNFKVKVKVDGKDETPASIAAYQGHVKTAKYLVSRGADASTVANAASEGESRRNTENAKGLAVLGLFAKGANAVKNSIASSLAYANSPEGKAYNQSHPICKDSKDDCYVITGNKDNGLRVKLTCTHGSQTGQEQEVCGNTKGKWATGCSLSYALAYYYTFNEAARIACNL